MPLREVAVKVSMLTFVKYLAWRPRIQRCSPLRGPAPEAGAHLVFCPLLGLPYPSPSVCSGVYKMSAQDSLGKTVP